MALLNANKDRNYILSGGSMMYIDAICKGIDEMPTIGAASQLIVE